jgi:hypothetical protein
MKTLILTGDNPKPLLVRETYWTVKKRIFDASAFIEVTAEGNKILFNKKDVLAVGTVEDDNKKETKK